MDGAMALGSTRWEAIRGVMFAYAAPGIAAAVLLGLGRAFGEAIAVTPGDRRRRLHLTLAVRSRRHAREPDRRRSTRAPRRRCRAGSILYLAAILMVISLVTNVAAQFIVPRVREGAEGGVSVAPTSIDPYDITVRSTGLRRRRITEKAFGVLGVAAALLAVAILALVLGTVIRKGLSELNLDFFTQPRPLFGESGRDRGRARRQRDHRGDGDDDGDPGRRSSSRSSCPSTHAERLARPADRARRPQRVPAVVVGIFVFGLLVVGHGQSAVFGAFSLAILMLPMVARATQEVLEIVPRSLREASLALGVTKWRTICEHHPPERDRRAS